MPSIGSSTWKGTTPRALEDHPKPGQTLRSSFVCKMHVPIPNFGASELSRQTPISVQQGGLADHALDASHATNAPWLLVPVELLAHACTRPW